MRLELAPVRVDTFERQMETLGPWMHAFDLGPQILTGNYKYEGLENSLTFVNRRSPDRDIVRMREAYSRRQHHVWSDFIESIFARVSPDPTRRASMRVLDIASATGQLSFRAVQAGFGHVISSEIRREQSAQEELLLESLKDETYRERITVLHDPISADVPEFPDRYRATPPDLVLSFGLLYHLANPVQHLVNLHAITDRHAVIYTMTHYHPLAKNMWYLTLENPDWITKAVSGLSWTPHFSEVARLLRKVGFRRVEICYPTLFTENFPEMVDGYSRWTDAKLLAQMAFERFTGIRLGHLRNHDFKFFKYSNLNPNYVAYVCEK